MRFTTSYYLLLLYCTVMFNPLILIVKDAVSHSFAEAYHVLVIHAQYGADHLENELANSGSNNDNSKNQSTVKSEEQVPVHVSAMEYQINFSLSITSEYFHSHDPENLPSVFILTQIPPPKSC